MKSVVGTLKSGDIRRAFSQWAKATRLAANALVMGYMQARLDRVSFGFMRRIIKSIVAQGIRRAWRRWYEVTVNARYSDQSSELSKEKVLFANRCRAMVVRHFTDMASRNQARAWRTWVATVMRLRLHESEVMNSGNQLHKIWASLSRQRVAKAIRTWISNIHKLKIDTARMEQMLKDQRYGLQMLTRMTSALTGSTTAKAFLKWTNAAKYQLHAERQIKRVGQAILRRGLHKALRTWIETVVHLKTQEANTAVVAAQQSEDRKRGCQMLRRTINLINGSAAARAMIKWQNHCREKIATERRMKSIMSSFTRNGLAKGLRTWAKQVQKLKEHELMLRDRIKGQKHGLQLIIRIVSVLTNSNLSKALLQWVHAVKHMLHSDHLFW